MCNVEIKYKDSPTTSGAGRKNHQTLLTTWTIFSTTSQMLLAGVANAIDTPDDTINETENESDVYVDIGKVMIIISFSLKVVPHGKFTNLFKFLKMGPVFTVCYH